MRRWKFTSVGKHQMNLDAQKEPDMKVKLFGGDPLAAAGVGDGIL